MSFARTAAQTVSRRQLFPLLRRPRCYSSAAEPDLKTSLREAIPAKQALLKQLKTHANTTIGRVKVQNAL
ncbi:MAG: hypothetical protein Q9193_002564, partial [Seirophora villosa]